MAFFSATDEPRGAAASGSSSDSASKAKRGGESSQVSHESLRLPKLQHAAVSMPQAVAATLKPGDHTF